MESELFQSEKPGCRNSSSGLIKLYLIFLTYKMRLVKPSFRIAEELEIMFIRHGRLQFHKKNSYRIIAYVFLSKSFYPEF